MKAGRELDALIAEKVMGRTNNATYYSNGDVQQDVPKYSTNIADAWLVLEKLDAVVQVTKWNGGYDCKIEGIPTFTEDTAPLAICLAALKAVDYEMED